MRLRWRRDAPGELGEPLLGGGLPVVPARWRLPVLLVVVVLCVGMFVAAVVFGLRQ